MSRRDTRLAGLLWHPHPRLLRSRKMRGRAVAPWILVGGWLLASPVSPGDSAGGQPPPAPVWVKACFHAHTLKGATGLFDDGNDSPAALAQRLADAGFDVAVHTPHSIFNRQNAGAAADWRAEGAEEAKLSTPSMLVAVGEELTVAHGPAYKSSYNLFGHSVGGNLDHLSLINADRYVDDGATIQEGCAAAHEAGGFCVVNHPGPGPMEWEPGYWEDAANRPFVDALEVYNGQAYATLGIQYEDRYLDATAYSGTLGGLHIAAEAAPDTHGAQRVAALRAKVAGFSPVLGAAATGATVGIPGGDPSGLELGAATMVLVDGDPRSLTDLSTAVLARKTVAMFGFGRLELDCPGLGEVEKTGAVSLHLGVGRTVGTITLYKEGVAVKTWSDADSADYSETVTKPTAYVWGLVDGTSRAMTSAIWYEP
jgi:hypothetical protein